MSQPRRENFEVSGQISMAGTVENRIHVPSGAVLELTGVAADGVVVTAGGYAHISGTTRTLTVTVGGRATLTGNCNGAVVNDGGEVIVEGVVEGPIIEYAGRTVIAPAASTRRGTHSVTRDLAAGRRAGTPGCMLGSVVL